MRAPDLSTRVDRVRRATPAEAISGPGCCREDDILEALQASAWPDCCEQDLRDHVKACESCASLVAIVLPLLDEHRVATEHAPVPTSGVVWWRAQMRARQEAARAASRPISIAQGVALACAAGLIAGGLSLLGPAAGEWLGWTGSLAAAMPALRLPSIAWSEVQWMAPLTLAVLLALTMVLVLAPVAVYLAGSEE